MDIPHLKPGMLVRTNVRELQTICDAPGEVIKYSGKGFYKVDFEGVVRTIHYKGLSGW
tara:strand:+ start:194 stop:367 length:174 start_codon:yes stop_codon:yes gene_type:complete